MKKNSTQHSEGKELLVNNHEPRVNDELVTVNDSQSIVDSLESAAGKKNFRVNDDLALFSDVRDVNRQTSNVNSAITGKEPRPNKNDPDPSGSFVFPARRSLAAFAKLRLPQRVGGLMKFIIKEIFCAVAFQNSRLVLLTVSMREKNNRGSVSR